MEGLVILLLEFLASAAMAAAALLWSLVAGAAALAAAPLVRLISKSRYLPKFLARAGGLAACLAVLIAAAIFLLNAFWFPPTVRFIADGVSARTGIEIRYASVEGSLLSGKLTFTGFAAERQGHKERDFSLAAERADVDLDLFSLLPGVTPTFEFVRLRNVSGNVTEHETPNGAKGGVRKEHPRPNFIIEHLDIENLSVRIAKPGPRELVFDMPRIESRPLRGRYAIFDVMFRSTVRGAVNGHEVRLTTREKPGGRIAEWDIRRMPVSVVSAFVHRAPFTWFKSGLADMTVRDEWRIGEEADVRMNWRIAIDEAQIEIPGGVGIMERALALAAREYVKARGGRIDIAFRLTLNEEEFDAVASRDAEALFKAAVDAFAAELAEEMGETKKKVKQEMKDAADAARDYIDRRRKKKQ